MALEIQKNEIRVALHKYHTQIIDLLKKYPNGYRLHEFNSEMKYISDQIKQELRNSDSKNNIRKALGGAQKEICTAAQKSIRAKKINSTLFFENYFGGSPQENRTVSNASYDLVIATNTNNVIAWVFAPNKRENINNFEIMKEVENNYSKECNKVVVKYPVEVEDVKSIPIKVNSMPVLEINNEHDTKPVELVENNVPKVEHLGKAIHDDRQTIEMANRQDDRRIYGFIYQKHIGEVLPDDVIAFDSPDNSITILTKTYEFNPALISSSGREHKFKELNTVLSFIPLLEVVNGKEDVFHARVLEEFVIRKPTDKEVLRVTGFPSTGVPLGWVRHDAHDILARYPFNPQKKTLKDTIYRSFFVVGTQGSGKTTAAKYLFQALTGYEELPPEKRPAIIILDGEMGENSFKQFTPEHKMKSKTRKFLSDHNISPAFVKVHSISGKAGDGDTTLGLDGLEYDDIPLFFENLQEKTENVLKQKLKLCFEEFKKFGKDKTLSEIRDTILGYIRTDPEVYAIQRPAIANALKAAELDIFDQPNKTKITTDLICQAGKISVIDVNGLDIRRRRMVAVFLLLLLHRFKDKEENTDPGVILVIDEAEQIFPIKCSSSEKAYVDRIIAKTKDIADNGRKRNFGQFICTHQAEGVDDRVVGLAETVMAFRYSGDEKWIKKQFGKNYVDEIYNLKVGECVIRIKISDDEQKPILTKIYFPDVSLQDQE